MVGLNDGISAANNARGYLRSVPPARQAPPRGRTAPGPFRWQPALVGGALCELVSSLWMSGAAGLVVLIAGYALLVGFAARNVAITGSVLVVAGLLANLTVMAVDGGMPVRGQPASSGFGPRHHAAGPGDDLTALGDVVAVPALGEVFSAGDLLLGAGVVTMFVTVAAPRRRGRRVATSR
jgi:hypothetical protein